MLGDRYLNAQMPLLHAVAKLLEASRVQVAACLCCPSAPAASNQAPSLHLGSGRMSGVAFFDPGCVSHAGT
jgi:hypothetical protein